MQEVKSNPISAWHGASETKLDSICWYGLLNLSTTDPGMPIIHFHVFTFFNSIISGYYGKGIYFTQKPSYGEIYSNNLSGKTSLLLCWVLLGRPWAVTKVFIFHIFFFVF